MYQPWPFRRRRERSSVAQLTVRESSGCCCPWAERVHHATVRCVCAHEHGRVSLHPPHNVPSMQQHYSFEILCSSVPISQPVSFVRLATHGGKANTVGSNPAGVDELSNFGIDVEDVLDFEQAHLAVTCLAVGSLSSFFLMGKLRGESCINASSSINYAFLALAFCCNCSTGARFLPLTKMLLWPFCHLGASWSHDLCWNFDNTLSPLR